MSKRRVDVEGERRKERASAVEDFPTSASIVVFRCDMLPPFSCKSTM